MLSPTRNAWGALACAAVTIASLTFVTSVLSREPSRGASFTANPDQTVDSLVVLGDSYAAGAGASNPRKRWVNLLAASTGWSITNLAQGGTGFVKAYDTGGEVACGRATCPSFGGMAERAKRDGLDPDVILVSGGRNDLSEPSRDEEEAVGSLFAYLEEAFPRARVLATNPLWDFTSPPEQLNELRSVVKDEVGQDNFLDIGQPLRGRPDLVADDDVHPSDNGHLAIADAIEASLNTALEG